MKTNQTLLLLVLILSLPVLACGSGSLPFFGPTPTPSSTATPTATLTPLPTSTPTITPTPVPALGVAVSGSAWQVTLTRAYRSNSLSSKGFPATTYTPRSGYIFLVVDVEFHNLDETQESSMISSDQVAIIGEDGQIVTANGTDTGLNGFCVGCVTMMTMTGSDLSMSFVFVMKVDEIDQTFKFQFLDVPLIPFSAE